MKQSKLYHFFSYCLVIIALIIGANTAMADIDCLVEIEEEEISEWSENESDYEEIKLGAGNDNTSTKVYLESSKLFTFLGVGYATNTPLNSATITKTGVLKLYILFHQLKIAL